MEVLLPQRLENVLLDRLGAARRHRLVLVLHPGDVDTALPLLLGFLHALLDLLRLWSVKRVEMFERRF